MDELYFPLYTTALGSVLLVAQNLLMLNVGLYRGKIGQAVGTGGDATLERLVRRHGNLAENAAIFVAALALYELGNGQTALALWTGAAFGAGRLTHAVAFSSDAGSHLVNQTGSRRAFAALRASGAFLTTASGVVLGIAMLVSVITRTS
ncbi:MAG: MAPEG family protein [Pseudomonadota bacterium]